MSVSAGDMTVPVSDMTDTAVLERRLVRWDYELLKTHNVPTADYEKANADYRKLSNTTKPETRAAYQATLLVQKLLYGLATVF